jgi:aspartate kinase
VAKVALLGVPDIPGIAASLFSALADAEIRVEMIVQSVMRGQVNDIAFLVQKSGIEGAIRVCRAVSMEIGAQGVTFDSEIAKVSVLIDGTDIKLPSKVFSALAHKGINIDMILATESAVTCVVSSSTVDDAIEALEWKFQEKKKS